MYFVVVVDDVGGIVEIDVVGFGLGVGISLYWVVVFVDVYWIDDVGVYENVVMWFGKCWVVMYEFYFVVGDID